MSATHPTDKRELRAAMRAERKRLSGLDATVAFRVADHAAQAPTGAVVAVYHAIGSELDAAPLAAALAAAGRELCLPVVIDMDAAMIFRRWAPGDPLEVDLAGVPAPLSLAETVEPDVIVTPLLAFDARGWRLGQGGGHYDRTFASLPGATRVGLAYAGQEVSGLTVEPHDVRLHGVLTEVGYRPFS